MKPYVDLGELLKDAPRSCWVTFDENETRLVGHGDTIEEAVEMAHKAGVEDPVLFWSPEKLVPRVLKTVPGHP